VHRAAARCASSATARAESNAAEARVTSTTACAKPALALSTSARHAGAKVSTLCGVPVAGWPMPSATALGVNAKVTKAKAKLFIMVFKQECCKRENREWL
jgi:hypothetical protein